MSDELRVWFEEREALRRDAAEILSRLDRFGAEEVTLAEARRVVKFVAGEAMVLYKASALVGTFGDTPDLLREIADRARNGDLGEFEREVCTAAYLEDQAAVMDDALRAPGGGDRA